MKLRDEYWVLTRNLETGTVARMTRIHVPELDPEGSRLPVKIRDLAEQVLP
jgi:hypothetical protein